MALKYIGWIALALAGAVAWGVLALHRGETISAAWLVLAAVGTYLLGYRFYSRFLADRVFGLNDRRATPAERLANGRDFVSTSRWVLFGHHFAAIAGAGPLVGPVLAAQFGYLPGTIWLIFGVVLGGAVQDFVILFGSMRRDGKSLGQMAKEETGPVTGLLAMVAVLAIMVILLAVLALVVVNALKDSPWGVFTILCTLPIAIIMGFWMKVWRPGRTLEASAFGVALLLAALVGGRYVAESPTLAPYFTASGITIAYGMIAYGFIASVLPVWMLLCPRDYLSTFMKIGTILLLALGILLVLPPLKMPAVTQFVDGSGPVFAGKLFPFAFITIACGAITNRCTRSVRGREKPAGPNRRSTIIGRRHGAHLQQRVRPGTHGAVVPLRDHVRGALYPHHGGHRNTSRPVHAAGARRPVVAAAGPDLMVSQHRTRLGPRGRRLGLLPGARRAGPTRWHQLSVAAVRHQQPASGFGRTLCRDHPYHQKRQGPLCLGHLTTAHVAPCSHAYCRLAEGFCGRPAAWLPGTRRIRRRSDGCRSSHRRDGRPPDLQRPVR